MTNTCQRIVLASRPQGIDAVFENVGGMCLDAALA
jgi:NADPH-dependent curcumin reductase CurA